MQIYWLIGLSSLAGALLFAVGALAGFLLATRSIKFGATVHPPKLLLPPDENDIKRVAPRPGGATPLPDPPKDSGPVKVMGPEDYERERMEPLRRRIGVIIGAKDEPKP